PPHRPAVRRALGGRLRADVPRFAPADGGWLAAQSARRSKERIAQASSAAVKATAHPTIQTLGTEAPPNRAAGPIILTASGSIVNAARRHSASAGLTRLATMPTLRAASRPAMAPTCSTQPPMNATPYQPRTMTPFVTVLRRVPPAMDAETRSTDSSSIKASAAPTRIAT